MIVKITKGAYFKGAEMYDTGKTDIGKNIEVLAFEGIDMDYDADGNFAPDTGKIARSFNMQANMNKRVKYPVKHLVFSWPQEDLIHLSNEKIVECVRKYLEKRGYVNTQFMITRHYEKDNPHVHVIINMVDNCGRKLDDYNEYKKNIEVCKELTREYGFTWGRCKWAHKSDIPCDSKRRTYEHARYDICKSVAQAMAKIKDIRQLPQRLALDGSGVTADIRYDSAGRPVGVSFSKTLTMEDGFPLTCKFSGSSLDRRFSCRNLVRILEIKDDFPRIAKQAVQMLEICNLAKDEYEIPRKVLKKCDQLEEEIRHLHYDQKRLEKEYAGDCFKGFVAVCIAIAYGTPLTALVTVLASTLVAGIHRGLYVHAKNSKAERRHELRNLLAVFAPAPVQKYNTPYDGHSHANDGPKEPKPTTEGSVVDDIMGGMRIRLG